MKFLIILLLLFSIQSISYSQPYNWSTPVAMTDSLTDNKNCEIVYINNENLLMFWERIIDLQTTAIFYRNLSTISEPTPVMFDSNVHFRNPQIWSTHVADTLIYLLYETNIGGDWDVYYMPLLNNGSFGNPKPLFKTNEDEININTSYNGTFENEIVWEQDSSIYHSRYRPSGNFEITLIDSGNCSNPVSGHLFIAYQKKIGDSSHIYMRKWYGYWDIPRPVYTQGHNYNLFAPKTFWNWEKVFCWENLQNDKHEVIFYNSGLAGVDFIPGSDKYDPSAQRFEIITKNSNDLLPQFVSFVGETDSTNQIFVTSNNNPYSFINLSDNSSENRNPTLFQAGNDYGVFTCLNVWESFHNNHWQLWMSDVIFFLSDLDNGNDITPLEFKLEQNYPNPFNPTTTIYYTVPNVETHSHASLQLMVLDVLGNEIAILVDEIKTAGHYEVEFNASGMSSGVYFYRLTAGKFTATRKMLLIK